MSGGSLDVLSGGTAVGTTVNSDGSRTHVSGHNEVLRQSWFRKSAQGDRWSFCLTAGTLCLTNQEKQ
jgi:autotransporter passenger strand-loop-strand repeat protein